MRMKEGLKAMFAVIKTGGKQYRVAAEDVIKIEKLAGEEGDPSLSKPCSWSAKAKVTVGAPLVDGATVAGEIVSQTRGPKITILKKRRRKNSRRKQGHRQDLTAVKITEILTGGAKPKAKKKVAKPAAETKPAEEAKPAKAEKPDGAAPVALFTAPDGPVDDLKKISGVGPVLEKKLNALGITQFAQVAAFSADDIARVDEELNFKGRIEREDWLSQAKALAEGAVIALYIKPTRAPRISRLRHYRDSRIDNGTQESRRLIPQRARQRRSPPWREEIRRPERRAGQYHHPPARHQMAPR
jgi:large subunit ribosomal protein L21